MGSPHLSRHSSMLDLLPKPEKIRSTRSRIVPQASDISSALSGIAAETQLRQLVEHPGVDQPLLYFKGINHKGVKTTIIQKLQQDAFCSDALILRRCPGEQFRIISTNEVIDNSVHSVRLFPGITDVFSKRAPLILEKSFSAPWKSLFYYKPQTLILIPINIYRVRPRRELMIECIAVLSYTTELLPTALKNELIFNNVISFCNLTAPLLYNVQSYDDVQTQFKEMSEAFESFQNVGKEIQDVSSCVNTICLESMTLFRALHAVAFIILDDCDAKLLKYCSFGGGIIHSNCPHRECHNVESIDQVTSFPAGWSAIHRKPIRANEASQLTSFCGAKNLIHSVGGCVVKNIMCFVVEDFSNDMSLVIELSEKTGGFSEDDEFKSILFAARVGPILSTSVMLDFTKRSVRRNEITNKVINNIKTVQVKKVRHLIDLKFNYSSAFRKRLFSYSFVLRRLDPVQFPSIILYMFSELRFIYRWRMRKATVIRFILSIKQGYRDNPYHNWRHACTTTHFAFVLLKQADLQKQQYLTDLEALAFFVACICHDVDHRGVNSRFMAIVDASDTAGSKPNSYLFNQEESLIQRQHLAITFQILNSDDCNIVENMSDDDYGEFIELVQLCVLATDITQYLQTREKHFEALKHFDKHSAPKRKSLLCILMTACNLSETVKPWDEYITTVKSVFSEFFLQGDDELKHGVTPNPTMDRRIAYIPQIEMRFINEIVRPAFQALYDITPKIEDCINKIDYFKELWLLSTKVFEKFAYMQNPLEILDLQEMKEGSLKSIPHPELEKIAYKLQQSITDLGKISSTMLDTNSKAFQINSLAFHATDIKSVYSTQIESSTKKDKFCKRTFKCCKFPSCFRHRGIDDAAVVRRCNQEDDFLQEQSHVYGRKRSGDEDAVYKYICGLNPSQCSLSQSNRNS